MLPVSRIGLAQRPPHLARSTFCRFALETTARGGIEV